MHMGTLDLEHVKIILASFGVRFSKLNLNTKKANHTAKRPNKLAVCVYVAYIWISWALNMSRSFWVMRCTFLKIAKTVEL